MTRFDSHTTREKLSDPARMVGLSLDVFLSSANEASLSKFLRVR
jgi:hypothetical protein